MGGPAIGIKTAPGAISRPASADVTVAGHRRDAAKVARAAGDGSENDAVKLLSVSSHRVDARAFTARSSR
jgi:hypothetical protein